MLRSRSVEMFPEEAKMADDSVNKKIVEYAEKNSGHPGKVDAKKEAQCWDLPEKALAEAGAKTSYDYQDITGKRDQDYIWGKEISILGVIPGDIVQFRDHEIRIDYTISGKLTMPDGKTTGFTRTESRIFKRGPQHSAIVSSYQGNGVMVIYEQHVNTPGKRRETVQKNEIYIGPTESQKDASFRSKTREFDLAIQADVNALYRMFSRKAIDEYRKEYKKGKIKMQEEERTFEVSVTGIVRAYRPEAK